MDIPNLWINTVRTLVYVYIYVNRYIFMYIHFAPLDLLDGYGIYLVLSATIFTLAGICPCCLLRPYSSYFFIVPIGPAVDHSWISFFPTELANAHATADFPVCLLVKRMRTCNPNSFLSTGLTEAHATADFLFFPLVNRCYPLMSSFWSTGWTCVQSWLPFILVDLNSSWWPLCECANRRFIWYHWLIYLQGT